MSSIYIFFGAIDWYDRVIVIFFTLFILTNIYWRNSKLMYMPFTSKYYVYKHITFGPFTLFEPIKFKQYHCTNTEHDFILWHVISF